MRRGGNDVFFSHLSKKKSYLGKYLHILNLIQKYIIQDSPDCVLQRSLTHSRLVPNQKPNLFKLCSSSCQAHNSHFDIFIIAIQPRSSGISSNLYHALYLCPKYLIFYALRKLLHGTFLIFKELFQMQQSQQMEK